METTTKKENVNILLSRKEAARFLGGICLTTLARLSIPCVRIRRRVFYKREVLELWVSSQIEHGGSHEIKKS